MLFVMKKYSYHYDLYELIWNVGTAFSKTDILWSSFLVFQIHLFVFYLDGSTQMFHRDLSHDSTDIFPQSQPESTWPQLRTSTDSLPSSFISAAITLSSCSNFHPDSWRWLLPDFQALSRTLFWSILHTIYPFTVFCPSQCKSHTVVMFCPSLKNFYNSSP